MSHIIEGFLLNQRGRGGIRGPRVNLAYQRADFVRASFVNDARTSRIFLEGERARALCVNDARIFWGKFCSGNDARLKFSKLTHFQIFA